MTERASSNDGAAAHHYGDERLRQIAAELTANHELRQSLDGQLDPLRLRKAELALADGTLYREGKARCKEIRQPFGRWVKKLNLHKWRMANYLMAAVRLEVDSQSMRISGLSGQSPRREDGSLARPLNVSGRRPSRTLIGSPTAAIKGSRAKSARNLIAAC